MHTAVVAGLPDVLSSATAVALAAAAYGAGTGVLVRRRVAAGVHRRYADERARPRRSYRWLPPLCAAAAAGLAWMLTQHGALVAAAYVLLVPGYAALCAIDLDVHRLPDVLTLPAYPVVAALLCAASTAHPAAGLTTRALVAAGATWAVFALLHLLSRGQLGWGDVKLAGPLGALLGWISWEHVAVGVYAMFLAGGMAAAWLLARRRAGRRSRLAFGPAMVLGAAATVAGLPWPG